MKALIPLAAAGAALAVAAPAAQGAVDLSGGATRLTLDRGAVGALGTLGIELAPTGPARVQGRHARFPISGGSIDPASAAGRIDHRGGLRLSAGGNSLKLSSFQVKVGRKITLSARVGSSRVTLFNLTGRPRVSRSGFGTGVTGLTARLNRTAARTLNTVFGVDAFASGLALGKVRVTAEPAETQLPAEGATARAIEPAKLQAIVAQGIAPGVIGPATLEGTTASFPITGGKAALDLSAADVRHSGGISLTKGATAVSLTDFDIRVGATPQLFASLNGGADKVAILDLDLSALRPTIAGRRITLEGAVARLTQGAADALNAAFGTTAFTAGLTLGTATVNATVGHARSRATRRVLLAPGGRRAAAVAQTATPGTASKSDA